MFDPTSENRCPSWEALKGMDYLPSSGSSGHIQFGTKRKFVFLGGSCCTWNNPFSRHRLRAPHFDKEKPKAKQADLQSWWEPYQNEAHGPITVCEQTQSLLWVRAPCPESSGTTDGARSGHLSCSLGQTCEVVGDLFQLTLGSH